MATLAALSSDGRLPVFPIQKEQRNGHGDGDSLHGSGGNMDTTATIYSDGTFQAVTHIWEDTKFRGFHGGAVVVVLDQNGSKVWASPTEVIGVDGQWVGTSDRTISWPDDNSPVTLPPDILANARGLEIEQTWDAENTNQVIQNWLVGFSTDAEKAKGLIQTIETILAGNGSSTSGGSSTGTAGDGGDQVTTP